MLNAKEVVSLGVPSERNIISTALRLFNTAVARGADEEKLKGVLRTLLLSKTPGAEDLGEWTEWFAPLADSLAGIRKGRVFYVPGLKAPWKRWGTDPVEPTAIKQMENACSLPVSAGGALMPDAHSGYGLPIGGVLAVRNAVIPYAVGVDIACRMRLTVVGIPYGEFERNTDRFAEALEAETRFGVGARFEKGERRSHPVMDEDWAVTEVTRDLKDKAAMQLGTSGSGNHFVEFGKLTVPEAVDEPGFRLPAGTYLALLSHSGSRGAGEGVAKFYSALAASLHPELPESLRHLAWLELGTDEGEGYWSAMQLMGRYAAANHELIHRHVLRHLGLEAIGMVKNHHNFAWKENHGGEELVVHRKGATPAGKGVLGVIPGSMGTPGFVVRGKGSPESYASCSHGAGRLMSRGAAFRTLDRNRMKELLDERGVRLLSGSLDESPEVYKDIGRVMASQSDLVDTLARFEPKLVKMAPEEDGRHAWILRKKKALSEGCS